MTDSPEPMDGSIISEEPSELPSAEDKAARKARRQTAIYPNTLRAAPKPFSRSAAKRESVMALGSIEHLQHYFTKTGIAAKQKPMGRTKGLVPAIGGARHVRAASSVTSIPELPPSPMVPTSSSRAPFMNFPKTYEVDPAQLRPGVVRDLKAVEHAWGLDRPGSTSGEAEKGNKFDVLSTLRITTRAIRSVRDYVVSLPDDHPTHTGKTQGPYRHPAFGAPTRVVSVPMNSGAQSLASVLQQTATAAPHAGLVSPKPRLAGLPGSPSLRPTPMPGSPSKLLGSPSLRPVAMPTSPSPRPSLLPTISVQNTGSSGSGLLSVQNTGGGSGLLSAQHTGSGGQLPFPSKPEEPLALVRRAALEVLVALRALEERARVSVEAEPTHSHVHGHAQEASSQSQDAPSVSSRSATPATFLSGDDAERESATSLSTSTFSPPSRPRPRLTIPTDSGSGAGTETLLIHGRGAVQIWSDSDSGDEFAPDEPEKREVWDERLVLGGGWLYRSDLGEEEVKAEREGVRVYLDVVDGVLFGGGRGGKRGWDRERRRARKSDIGEGSVMSSDDEDGSVGGRRVSQGLGEAMRYLSMMEEEGVLHEEDEGEEGEEGGEGDVPEWATVEPFGSDLIARTNALLHHFLPPALGLNLPTPATRDTLLSCLSDGQLLCMAYNSAVRKSKKAWGFINVQSIHETAGASVSAEDKAAGSWTFRRKENLGLWAAALKLRYVIDIVPADQKSSHPTRHFHRAPLTPAEPGEGDGLFEANVFSPIVIAKKEKGWEDMLERAIWAWVNAVVTETKESAGVV